MRADRSAIVKRERAYLDTSIARSIGCWAKIPGYEGQLTIQGRYIYCKAYLKNGTVMRFKSAIDVLFAPFNGLLSKVSFRLGMLGGDG